MKYFVDPDGKYLGGFDCDPKDYPKGILQEVPFPPADSRQRWTGAGYDSAPADQKGQDRADARAKLAALSASGNAADLRAAAAALLKVL